MADLLTTEDLLHKFRISRKTLDNHIARGELPPPLRIGRRRYWLESTIEAVITTRTPALAALPGGRHE